MSNDLQTVKQKDFPEIVEGVTLTVKNDNITIGGQIVLAKGQKVEVEGLEIREGHYYRPLPDIWIDAEITGIKLKGISGHWFPRAFVEFHNQTKP